MTHKGDPSVYLATYVLVALALPIASLRWLRVCQREHYMGGYTTRFAIRWWLGSSPANLVALLVAAMAALAAVWTPVSALVTAGLVVVAPLGLGIRGRTSKLVFTGRLRRLAAPVIFDLLIFVAAFWFLPFGMTFLALSGLTIPLLVDLYAGLIAPVERKLSQRFIGEAQHKLRQVRPLVVGVTGSYGKTTAKEYIRHLLSGTYRVVASPASFNNQLGLARTVNEHLTAGTEVLIAEMGDYGPGEISEMCTWLQPKIGVVTAVGYEHFERFKSMEAIAESKREIFTTCETAVLGIDTPPLDDMAIEIASAGAKRVMTVSGEGREADISALGDGVEIRISAGGDDLGTIPKENRHPLNVAIAVAVAIAMDVPLRSITNLLPGLESPAHRATMEVGPTGVTIIDDTYNSNPVGAAAALDIIARSGAPGRKVVVTPGMVEMGTEQHRLNSDFAAKAGEVATDLLIVGYTNRLALREGASRASQLNVIEVRTRENATSWVRENLGDGDIVLYENDLPDHFP
ncbi:MAG: hypothetical protein DCC49_11805 [Acidobacteria bacterium]|nr:MAG: hypothetical protein DCC49_11805 [Acidobacteriota bacterium]